MVKNLTYFDEDNMSLDYVMLLNLARREDRYWFALGSLKTLKFPDNVIQRFITYDGLDYPDKESVWEAAIADGFEYLSDFVPMTRATAAWVWSWRSALRLITEMDKTVLLLIDDYTLKHGWTYDRVRGLIDACVRKEPDHGPFRLLQLAHTHRTDEVIKDLHEPYTTMLARGLAGTANYATILNAEGAKLLLKIGQMEPLDYPAADFGKLTSRSDESDYYYGTWHTLDEICDNNYDLGNDMDPVLNPD